MLRPNKGQIDAEILDRAAALFARHDFANTSLQQIADAVGYSKAGLLHHFPSKKAIYEAAIDLLAEHIDKLFAKVSDIPPGPLRDLAVVEDSVDFAFSKPGISALGNRIAACALPDNERLQAIGLKLYECLGMDMTALETDRLVRVTSAFSGLGITASIAVQTGLTSEWRVAIVAAALDALGHGNKN